MMKKKTIFKKEIISRLSLKADCSHQTAERICDTLLKVLADAFANGENVTFQGFGGFTISHQEGREMRDYQSKQKKKIDGFHTISFHQCKPLKEKIKSKKAAKI